MSLMSAEISQGANQAFGRGLFVIDPDEADRKAKKQLSYQQDLKIQMEQARRRKEQQKRKEREEDLRHQRKFYQQLQVEKQKKKNQKNVASLAPAPVDIQNTPMTNSQYMKESPKNYHQKMPETRNYYNFQIKNQVDAPREENPYLNRQLKPMIYDMEQQHFYQQSSNQKIRVLKEFLDEKLSEVYKRLKGSKDLQIDREIQQIRKKINSYNQGYQNQNPRVEAIDQGFSQFYQIPNKKNYYQYNSNPRLQSNKRVNSLYPLSRELDQLDEPIRGRQSRPVASRAEESRAVGRRASNIRDSRSSNDQGWGRKRGKDNFLGNRQALDYKIESMLGNIDNILSGSEPL